MKDISKPAHFFFMLTTCLLCIKCTGRQKANGAGSSPAGYDLSQPAKYNMPDNLTEISGIAFNQGNPDTMYAEQDEKGELFHFKPGSSDVQHVKFGKSGDYEDLAISNGQVIMLRSDGTLYTFPLKDLTNAEIATKQQDNLLPQGEYEGLYADDTDQSVYVLCKHCSMEKSSKTSTVFNLKLSADGSLKSAGQFDIDVKKIGELAGKKIGAFHPSALSKNPKTNEWYILSSVNKLLVVADASWAVKQVFALNPRVFHQPEGMAFDKQNNLYISNEGDKLSAGNVLKFAFKK
jgi:uncharacterized protein YjiK